MFGPLRISGASVLLMGELDAAGAGNIVLRTLIVYTVLLIGVRFSGKREIGQMAPFDLIVLLLISNAVQNAMTGEDTSVLGGMVAAGTLLTINVTLAKVSYRIPRLRRLLDGIPVLLVAHGRAIHQNLRREGILIDELMAALREHECATLEEVEIATLEINGEISVIRCDGSEQQISKSRSPLRKEAEAP